VLRNIGDSLKAAAPSREGAFARVLDVRGHLPVEVRFFSFDINRVDGVQAEPCGEGKSILVRPLCKRRQDNRLQKGETIKLLSGCPVRKKRKPKKRELARLNFQGFQFSMAGIRSHHAVAAISSCARMSPMKRIRQHR
jgi:hypothetical protein